MTITAKKGGGRFENAYDQNERENEKHVADSERGRTTKRGEKLKNENGQKTTPGKRCGIPRDGTHPGTKKRQTDTWSRHGTTSYLGTEHSKETQGKAVKSYSAGVGKPR